MIWAVAYGVEFRVTSIDGCEVFTEDNVLDMSDIERWRFDQESDQMKMDIFDTWVVARRQPQPVSHDWRDEGF